MLLSQLTILATMEAGRRHRIGACRIIVLGALLGACLLTRHVAIGLVPAVLLDSILRRRWSAALMIAALASILFLPGWSG